MNQEIDRFELFKKMANNILGYAIDALFGAGSKAKGNNLFGLIAIIIILATIGILLYAGAEVVSIFSRNKFGKDGVKKWKVITAFFAFLVLSYFCYNSYKDYYGFVTDYGSEYSYLYASITFLVTAMIVLLKGISAGDDDNNDVTYSIYRGDSWLLGGLIKDGVKQSTVQNLAEPLLFLAIGFCLFSYNYFWGIPFMFCAISCWFHLAIESSFGFFRERNYLSNEGRVYTKNRKMSKVIS